MAIFDRGPQEISDYISDINSLIISVNASRSTSIPTIRLVFGAADMLQVLNQTVQAINSALGSTLSYFRIPLDTSMFLNMINSLSIIAAGVAVNIPGFHNFTGSNLSNWAAAKAARAAGTRNATVLEWSDSTGAGFGATPTNVNAALSSRFAQLGTLLGNSSISSFFSDYNVNQATAGSTTLPTFDSRRVVGSSIDNNDHTLGGATLLFSGATPLSFTPTNQVDSFDLYYPTFSTFGTMSWQIDSGTVNNVSQAGSTALVKLTVNVALGNHTIKIAQVSGAVAFFGVVAYNSAAKEISLVNAGYCGATSTILTDPNSGFPWNNAGVVTKLAPDLTIIEGGQVNDWVTPIPRATSISNLQSMITTAKQGGTGDVILTTANPSQASGTSVPYATQQGYVDDMIALAITNGIPCIDVWRLFGGTWEAANALGYNFDIEHPSGAGYGAIAGYLNTALATGFRSFPGA